MFDLPSCRPDEKITSRREIESVGHSSIAHIGSSKSQSKGCSQKCRAEIEFMGKNVSLSAPDENQATTVYGLEGNLSLKQV